MCMCMCKCVPVGVCACVDSCVVFKSALTFCDPEPPGIFTESVKTTFEDISDLMPPERFKYIHTVGAVATITFEASSTPHPFTGLFATGAAHGLLRLSTATPVDASADSSITPGLALKLLRDGVPSANLFAMPSLDGQTDFNILRLNYSNHLEYPSSWALNMVAQKFTQASNCPLMVGLGHVAAFGEDGAQVANPQMPFEVILVPNKEVKAFPSAPYSNDDFLAYAELGIEAGTSLFEVYGRASPRADDVTDIHLGTVKTTSAMTRSTFGDTQLMFAHEYMENDFSKHPEWLPELDLESACGTPQVTPTPPDTTLAHTHAARGKSSSACPFASARSAHPRPLRLDTLGAGESAEADGSEDGYDGCPYLRARARQKQKELEAQERLVQRRSESAVA
jgi:hypothetical protein